MKPARGPGLSVQTTLADELHLGAEVPPRVPQRRLRTSSRVSATPAGPAGSRRAPGADGDSGPHVLRGRRRGPTPAGSEHEASPAPGPGEARGRRARGRRGEAGPSAVNRRRRTQRAEGFQEAARTRVGRAASAARPDGPQTGGPEVKPRRSEGRPGPLGLPWGAGFARAAAPHRGPRRGRLGSPDVPREPRATAPKGYGIPGFGLERKTRDIPSHPGLPTRTAVTPLCGVREDPAPARRAVKHSRMTSPGEFSGRDAPPLATPPGPGPAPQPSSRFLLPEHRDVRRGSRNAGSAPRKQKWQARRRRQGGRASGRPQGRGGAGRRGAGPGMVTARKPRGLGRTQAEDPGSDAAAAACPRALREARAAPRRP